MQTIPRIKAAILIVVYNTDSFIIKQIETIRRFCKDSPDIIIIDNSTIQEVTDTLLYRIQNLDCIYHKTNASSGDPSLSHAFASNWAYWKYKDEYDYMMFMDHDLFSIKEFSIPEVLLGKKMAALGQTKPSGKTYLWPGALFIDNTQIDKELVDFSPNIPLGLDTGGNLFELIDKYGKEEFVFLNERYEENMHYTKLHYNSYAIIADGLFMHFINGSRWNQSLSIEDQAARISGLMAILNEKIS